MEDDELGAVCNGPGEGEGRERPPSTAALESSCYDAVVVLIVGCTGVGKTKLSLLLGQHFNGEIINTDAMQLYQGLDVITNKATAAEQACVPHHLLSVLPSRTPINVNTFATAAHHITDRLIAAEKLPILVGGTNYYSEAAVLATPTTSSSPSSSSSFRSHGQSATSASTSAGSRDLTTQQAFARLTEVDPKMAERLHQNDRRKILRSLAIFDETGKRHSDLVVERSAARSKLRHTPTLCFWIDCDQTELDRRLDNRVDDMVGSGLLRELVQFHMSVTSSAQCGVFASATGKDKIDYEKGVLQTIGYKEFAPFFEELAGTKMVKERIDEGSDCATALKEGYDARDNDAREDEASYINQLLVCERSAPCNASCHEAPNAESQECCSELLAPDFRRDGIPPMSAANLGHRRVDVQEKSSSILTSSAPAVLSQCHISDANWANFEAQLACSESLMNSFNECLEKMKQRTRRYARKQTQWIRQRLCKARPGFRIYRLDASNLATWDKDVFEEATAVMKKVLVAPQSSTSGNGSQTSTFSKPHPMQARINWPPPSNIPVEPFESDEVRLHKWKKMHCALCDKTLNGSHEWEVHLKTKLHRKRRGGRRKHACAPKTQSSQGIQNRD